MSIYIAKQCIILFHWFLSFISMLSVATSFPTQLYVSKVRLCNRVWLEFSHFYCNVLFFCIFLPHFAYLSFFIDEHMGYFQFAAVANSAAASAAIASQLQIHTSLPCFGMLELDPVNILLFLLDLSIEGSGKTL